MDENVKETINELDIINNSMVTDDGNRSIAYIQQLESFLNCSENLIGDIENSGFYNDKHVFF